MLNSAVSDPITHEPDYEDIDEILALVPRTEAELAERYCAIARDTNTAQLLGMMTLKHPNEVMRRFAVTDNPIEIDDAYALNMRTGVGSSLVRHVESEALKRGHGETVLVSGPRYEISRMEFLDKSLWSTCRRS